MPIPKLLQQPNARRLPQSSTPKILQQHASGQYSKKVNKPKDKEELFMLKAAKKLGDEFRKIVGENFQYTNVETDPKVFLIITNLFSQFIPTLRRQYSKESEFDVKFDKLSEAFYNNIYGYRLTEMFAVKIAEVVDFMKFDKNNKDKLNQQYTTTMREIFTEECVPEIERTLAHACANMGKAKDEIYYETQNIFLEAKETLLKKNIQFESLTELTDKIFNIFNTEVTYKEDMKKIATEKIKISDDKIINEFCKLCGDETISIKKIQKSLEKYGIGADINSIVECRNIMKKIQALEEEKNNYRREIDLRYQRNKELAKKKGVLDEFCIIYGRDEDRNPAIHRNIYE